MTDPFSPLFLFGGTSIIGWNILRHQATSGMIPFCNTHTNEPQSQHWVRLNLEDESALFQLFKKFQPRLLIHCGGICDVEKSEKHPNWAWKINVTGMEYLLRTLPKQTRLVYVSSDHVFSGLNGPTNEQSPTDPISLYGQTRVAAERLILQTRPHSLIIRPGLPIGPSINKRTGHLNWLQYRTHKNLPVTVVEDEHRSAVWARDLAKRIMDLAQSPLVGIRHVAAERAVSRRTLAEFLNSYFHIGANIKVEKRLDRSVPHLGQVELQTIFDDPLSDPLPSVVLRSFNAVPASIQTTD